MKILVVHQFFLRDGDAGGSRFNDMASVWVDQGHDVTVLAGNVHYQTGRDEQKEESATGIRVIRVRAAKHTTHTARDRIRSYASFAVNATRALRRVEKPDVVIASSPSLPVIIPGLMAKARWNIPLVFEVRDLWPESAITTGVLPASSPIAKASYALEETGYELSDHVVALTDAIRANIIERGFCSDVSISVIPNGVDTLGLPTIDRERTRKELGWGDAFVSLYAGAHGIANHLETVVEAAMIARDDPTLRFVCVGDGPRRLDLMRMADGLTNVDFLPAVSKENIYRYIGAADAGIAILQKNPTFKTVYPNKVFDYMAMGRPVICAIEGAAADLVQDAEMGVTIRPEDPDALLKAARNLRDHPRDWSHGAAFVHASFDRRDIAMRYLALLHQLTDIR